MRPRAPGPDGRPPPATPPPPPPPPPPPLTAAPCRPPPDGRPPTAGPPTAGPPTARNTPDGRACHLGPIPVSAASARHVGALSMNRRLLTVLALSGLICLGFMLAEELSART